MTSPQNAPAYEDDFVAWLEDQAGRARRGETEGLDLENIAEELEGMARSDRREIRNRLTVLLTHLLKCLMQPKRRSSSWLGTIAERRDGIANLIEDSPSLRSYPAEILDRCYPTAPERGAPNAVARKRLPRALSGRHGASAGSGLASARSRGLRSRECTS